MNVKMLTIAGAMLMALVSGAFGDEWPHYAGDAARTGTAPRAARDLDTVRWSVSPEGDEEYVWSSSPVVYGGRVFVAARYYTNDEHVANRVIAYDVEDGERLWATEIEIDFFDSWSSPAVDVRNGRVLAGSGLSLYALETSDGVIVWQTTLAHKIVNASPLVTADLDVNGAPANRAFVTDYTGSGLGAKLYAINVDPYDAIDNPYEPGDIVWTETLPGASGNTPAYADGLVYVTSVDGAVKALGAADGSLAWETDACSQGDAPCPDGFFGGIAIRDGYAYAASYSFYGAGDNSELFKFSVADGTIVWATPCERTNSIPVLADDGRIFLSAGLDGYGSVVRIEAFQDDGPTATKLWDTYVDTGGALVVGGWTHQPAYSRGYLYAGAPPDDAFEFFLPYVSMYVLDADRTPGDPDFIVNHFAGTGGSPAIADGTVYSFGEGGLYAFEPSPACLADLDGDGWVGLSDLGTLLPAYGAARGEPAYDSDADLNRDGVVNLADLSMMLSVYGQQCS